MPEAGRQEGGHEATRLPPGKLYLRNWRFHEANPQLLSDYATPPLFSLGFAEQAGLVSVPVSQPLPPPVSPPLLAPPLLAVLLSDTSARGPVSSKADA